MGGYSSLDLNLYTILRQVINFPVAIFIFLAGYFTNVLKATNNTKKYLLSRAQRLLLPYICWSLLYFLFDLIMGSEMSLYDILWRLFTGKASTQLYYIVVLIQLTILTPWILKLKRREMLYLVTPVYLIYVYSYNAIVHERPALYETLFPAWLFFFILGMDCSEGKFDNIIKKVSGAWVLIGLAVSIIESLLLIDIWGCSVLFAQSQIKFGSFLYACSLALLFAKYNAKYENNKNVLTVMGDYSYGIYLSHMIVMFFVKKVLYKLIEDRIWLIDFSSCFVGTVVGTLLLDALIKVITPKLKIDKFANKAFGI